MERAQRVNEHWEERMPLAQRFERVLLEGPMEIKMRAPKSAHDNYTTENEKSCITLKWVPICCRATTSRLWKCCLLSLLGITASTLPFLKWTMTCSSGSMKRSTIILDLSPSS